MEGVNLEGNKNCLHWGVQNMEVDITGQTFAILSKISKKN